MFNDFARNRTKSKREKNEQPTKICLRTTFSNLRGGNEDNNDENDGDDDDGGRDDERYGNENNSTYLYSGRSGRLFSKWREGRLAITNDEVLGA